MSAAVRRRFETTPPTQLQALQMSSNRSEFAELAETVEHQGPPSRERSLALTALEEAKFWANQALMMDQQPDA